MKIVHELDPYSVFYHAVHGQLLYQAGRHADAAVMARRAITLNPNSWLGHHILGKILIESGDLDAALTELQQAFELSGGSTPIAPQIHHRSLNLPDQHCGDHA